MKTPKKKILFITGTRADYGKLKPLMQSVTQSPDFDCKIFVTGMHTLEKYGFTVEELRKDGFEDLYVYVNQIINEPMDMVLANTIHGLARYVHDSPPDLIIIHGDRVEALAGAIVGSLRNILTAHIEGGELSGTVDELIRHAVSKLSHVHFVANAEAANRLAQMGEDKQTIYQIGSPDIDIMLSKDLPSIAEVKKYYELSFDKYGIGIFHPVTTEQDDMESYAEAYVQALIDSGENHLIIYPNNDSGASAVFSALKKFEGNKKFRCLPSLRFEYFLTFMKNAQYVVGNSSAGVREAPVYGVPTVNIGTRQQGRFSHPSIIDVGYDKTDILKGIKSALKMGKQEPIHHFGKGNSRELFNQCLKNPEFWNHARQKSFQDLPQALLSGKKHAG